MLKRRILNPEQRQELHEKIKEFSNKGKFDKALELNDILYESNYNILYNDNQMKKQYIGKKEDIIKRIGEEGYHNLIYQVNERINKLLKNLEELIKIGQDLTEKKKRIIS